MRKFTKPLMFVALAGTLLACTKQTTGEANYQVIPLPLEVSTSEGQPFVLTSATKVVYPEGNDLMARNAEFLGDYLNLPVLTSTPSNEKVIELALGLDNDNKEAYRLEVTENKVTITGASEAGVF